MKLNQISIIKLQQRYYEFIINEQEIKRKDLGFSDISKENIKLEEKIELLEEKINWMKALIKQLKTLLRKRI